jgi:hypothetical protein
VDGAPFSKKAFNARLKARLRARAGCQSFPLIPCGIRPPRPFLTSAASCSYRFAVLVDMPAAARTSPLRFSTTGNLNTLRDPKSAVGPALAAGVVPAEGSGNVKADLPAVVQAFKSHLADYHLPNQVIEAYATTFYIN